VNPSDKLDVYRDDSGQYRWRVIAANGRTIASSGESFDSKANATRAAHRANPEGSQHDAGYGLVELVVIAFVCVVLLLLVLSLAGHVR
jgi:uncharacterized protein YegP (UPF0339 family)